MQAIQTKFIPATNTRGSRIKATCARGSAQFAYPHELNQSDVHQWAAKELCKRFAAQDVKQYGTPMEKNPWIWPTVCGGLKDGTEVHVFLPHA